jgi:hypothetical protein
MSPTEEEATVAEDDGLERLFPSEAEHERLLAEVRAALADVADPRVRRLLEPPQPLLVYGSRTLAGMLARLVPALGDAELRPLDSLREAPLGVLDARHVILVLDATEADDSGCLADAVLAWRLRGTRCAAVFVGDALASDAELAVRVVGRFAQARSPDDTEALCAVLRLHVPQGCFAFAPDGRAAHGSIAPAALAAWLAREEHPARDALRRARYALLRHLNHVVLSESRASFCFLHEIAPGRRLLASLLDGALRRNLERLEYVAWRAVTVCVAPDSRGEPEAEIKVGTLARWCHAVVADHRRAAVAHVAAAFREASIWHLASPARDEPSFVDSILNIPHVLVDTARVRLAAADLEAWTDGWTPRSRRSASIANPRHPRSRRLPRRSRIGRSPSGT